MGASQLTETIIIRLKEGITLQDISSDTPATKAFKKLTESIKSQAGFTRQYWARTPLGHQVEDSKLFVWSIDWKSKSEHDKLLKSEDLKASVAAGLGELSDMAATPPLITYTEFKSDPTAAYTAPVTEVAFISMPSGYGEAEKYAMDHDLSHVGDEVKTIGKAWGSATGWIIETVPSDTEPAGETIALLGVFGYASIADHMAWRETPEHAKIISQMEKVAEKTGMTSPKAAIFDGRTMFHVHFQAGI